MNNICNIFICENDCICHGNEDNLYHLTHCYYFTAIYIVNMLRPTFETDLRKCHYFLCLDFPKWQKWTQSRRKGEATFILIEAIIAFILQEKSKIWDHILKPTVQTELKMRHRFFCGDQAWAGMSFAHLDLRVGNGQVYSQLLRLVIKIYNGDKNKIFYFWD